MDPRQARVLNKQLVTLDGTSWHKAHMLLDFMFNFTALESRNLQLVLSNYELCRSKVRPDDVNDFISITNVNPLVKLIMIGQKLTLSALSSTIEQIYVVLESNYSGLLIKSFTMWIRVGSTANTLLS
jgi:hypothetical protein